MSTQAFDELYDVGMTIQRHFAQRSGADPATLALDLELKRVPPNRRLVIKQVRPYSGPR